MIIPSPNPLKHISFRDSEFEKSVKLAACDLKLQPEENFIMKICQVVLQCNTDQCDVGCDLDSIAVSVFVFIFVELDKHRTQNTESEPNPNNNLMMRRAGLSR